MQNLIIRTAGLADAGALAGLVAGFRDHLKAATPRDVEIAAHLPGALADPGIEFACAFRGGEAVGFSQLRLLGSIWAPPLEAFLEDLYVAPAARRTGVARALLRHVLERARAHGAARLGLTTNEGNVAAQALYRAEGLVPQSHALYPGGREVLWARSLHRGTP